MTARVRLIADIGGTNARFALVGADGRLADEQKLAVASFPGVIEAARAYLAGRRVEEAVFAVATPVQSDEVAFTNSPWRFSIEAARAALGLERLAVLNDFAAQALAIARLGPDDFHLLQAGERVAGCPIAVIGPGTGLGVAGLLPHDGGFRPLASEGGHVSFAPTTLREIEVLRVLLQTHPHVSTERLLSGPGLLNIARALARIDGETIEVDVPRDVSARAAAGTCPVSAEAIQMFSHVLGAAAADLALTLLARGGVFVVGGLCRGLGALLDAEAFRAGFTAKGRFKPWLERIAVHQVLREHTGLLGVAAYQIGSSGSAMESSASTTLRARPGGAP